MPTDPPLLPPPPGGTENETTDPELRPPRTPRPDSLIGKVLDQRYRIVGLLARGGMGRVYRAEQLPMGRRVAIKVLDVGLEHDEDQEFRTRFIKEAETSARLTHPNTVRVFDYGKTWDDVLYIAMEYLDGRNLYQVLQTDAPMDARRVARIGRQVASSLREAHGLGLIHRDLKPSNIILTRPGGDEEFVKVVDFGLVKEIRADSELTRDDALVGSPSYMSPEQIRSAALDERSDIYSLGVLLYACLTGRAPFVGATSLNVLMGHLNQAPPPMVSVCPSMKPAPTLEAVVMKCLAKAPADRYPSMEALLRALQACEEELGRAPTPVLAEPTFSQPTPVLSGSEVLGRGGGPPRNAPPVSASSRAPSAADPAPPSASGPGSEVSLVLPPRGPSPRLVAGIGVAAVLVLLALVSTVAWIAVGVAGSGTATTVTREAPEEPQRASVGASTPEAVVPVPAATPEPPPTETQTSGASSGATGTTEPAPAPAPAREPRARRSGGGAASVAPVAPAATSPAASAPDTPPAPPPTAPVTAPPPAARTSGSDVRDPWETR